MDDEKYKRRQRNIEIFKNTERRYTEITSLADAIDKTVMDRKLILEKDRLSEILPSTRGKQAEIIVSGRRSFEAACRYAYKKVCVLNFASATRPGGGVLHGSSAQEESLCRCSTLYPTLSDDDMWSSFYEPHREAENSFYNDDIIYCPRIIVFKSDDDFPKMLPREHWYTVDVLTCAAPNLRHFCSYGQDSVQDLVKEIDLKRLLDKRIRRIFEVTLRERIDVLILGAFGCGAFCNPPDLVASIFRKAVETYGNYFETIEFAVFHKEHETKNFVAFKQAFADFVRHKL